MRGSESWLWAGHMVGEKRLGSFELGAQSNVRRAKSHNPYRLAVTRILAAVVGVLIATIALAQNFQSQGPAPSSGRDTGSNDLPPIGTASGGIQAIAPDPVDSNTLYIGAVNGGVWVTHNAGASWTPLSDKQSSLSIASIALDPTDPTRKTVIAGIGSTSNGGAQAGQLIGVLYSTNGGTSWSELGGTTLNGLSVIGVAARGTTFLAATGEPTDLGAADTRYGLYRSTNSGASFTQLGAGANLPAGTISALVGDPTNPNLFYVAVNAAGGARGIYKSTDTGASWNAVGVFGPPLAASEYVRLAAGPNGSVAAAVFRDGALVGVTLSKDSGATWVAITDGTKLPVTNPGGQAATNLAIAIDKSNPNIVYLAGDAVSTVTANGYTVTAFRMVFNADGSTSFQRLTDGGTADNSTVHADARVFAFDAAGRLLLGGDGGIYARSNPADSSGVWTGLNTAPLSVREIYVVAYDAVHKRLVVAAQDNGIARQTEPGGAAYDAIGSGDGTNAVVNDRTRKAEGLSVTYSSSQSLGDQSFVRRTEGPNGSFTDTFFVVERGVAGALNFEPDDYREIDKFKLPFSSRIVLNRKDPQKIAFGTNYVYTTTDAGAAADTLSLTSLGTAGSITAITALAYGTNDNIDAILAGSSNGLFLSTTAGSAIQRLTPYTGTTPLSVVFDYRAAARFYAVDGAALWGTTNSGAAFTDLTSNLTPLDIIRPKAVEFISSNGVNALLVGGLNSIANAQSPIAVADSSGSGVLSGWRPFGFGLPNTIVEQLTYNPEADVLAVAQFGRGAWLLYDVTSYFSSATVLRFGLADNDSAPDASFLTGARPLEKVGAGTLTIAGTATYTGATTISGGTMVVNGSIASSSSLLVDTSGTLQGNGTVPATTVNGTVAPGYPGSALTVNGSYTQNPGSTYHAQVNAAGQSDRINVVASGGLPGTASLAGSVSLAVAPGNYLPQKTFTLLNSAGGRTGTFTSASSNYTFLQPSLSYDANNAYVTLTPGGFAQGGQTPNQQAVGAALDRSVATASGDFAVVLGALSLLSTSQAASVLNQISGQSYSGFATNTIQTIQLFMSNFAQQVGGGQTGRGQRIALVEACDVACEGAAPARWGAWGGGLGGTGTMAGDANNSGGTFSIGGFAAGLDYRFDPRFLAGIALGYTSSVQYRQGTDGRGTSDAVQAALYGSFNAGSFYLDGLAGYARSDNRMVRTIAIPGLELRTAFGQTTTDQFFGQLEAGYKIGLGGLADAFLSPFVRLQGSTAMQAAFTETGANSLNLNVAAQTTNSLRSVLGAQLGGGIDVGWRDKLALVWRLGWSYEHADTSRPVNASFAGAPASSFSVAGVAAPRDGAILGFAANTAIADATSLYLRYDGEMAGGNTSHIFSAGIRITW